MPRVITITIPDDQNVSEVDNVIDAFQSELGHVCGDDEWTDRTLGKTLDHLPENEEVYECLDNDCGWWERKFHWYKDEIPTECEDCDGPIKEGTMDYDI